MDRIRLVVLRVVVCVAACVLRGVLVLRLVCVCVCVCARSFVCVWECLVWGVHLNLCTSLVGAASVGTPSQRGA